MSDHYHPEYADQRHEHREYAADGHDHYDYAERHHRHYDDESTARGLRGDLGRAEERIRELEDSLRDALERIRDLERLRPTCAVCLDATATQQTVNGPACSGCAGEPGEEAEPEPWDPGPEIDDEGGMSEYRYVLPEDYERGQS